MLPEGRHSFFYRGVGVREMAAAGVRGRALPDESAPGIVKD